MRVDLQLLDRRCYTYENYAGAKVAAQLERLKIPHKVIYLGDGCLQDYLLYAQHSPPSWTLSFTNLLPHQTPLCDVMRIPQFLWLEGSFSQAIHYLNSSFGKVGVSHESLCQKLSTPNLFFLPSGLELVSSWKKLFDLILFSDLIALSFLEKTWQEMFTTKEIIEIKQGVEKADPLASISKFYYIEQYLQANKTLKNVTVFQEVPLHVFGEHAGADWLVQLRENIHLHTPLPFAEHFEVLKASAMIIAESHSPWYLPAIACGCLPVSANEEEVKFYLKYPHLREKQLNILQNHIQDITWEKQVNRLLEIMRTQ